MHSDWIRNKRMGSNGGTGANYHPSNNRIELLNGTIRDREKTFRGISHMGTTIFDGMRVHYNHVRRHNTICKTHAEAARISTRGATSGKSSSRIQAPA